MTGELNVIDHTGDTKLIWDSEKPAEVEAAKKMFTDLRAKGDQGEVVREFNPCSERIILAPPVAGG